MALDRACNHEEACTFNSRTRAWLAVECYVPVRQAAHAQGNTPKDFVAPAVFQAAGPTADSIQSTVDAFRAALGDPNNGNNPRRSTEAVAARSTGTAATPMFWIQQPR